MKEAVKPPHYKVLCISMYTKDIEDMDKLVDELKSRGMTRANRSALIRYALSRVDINDFPAGRSIEESVRELQRKEETASRAES